MKIYNYMEDIVKDILDDIIVQKQDICKCAKCKLDTIAWSLNRLPSKYIVSDKGRVYAKLKQQEMQFRADVVRELAKAIALIKRHPRH
ncbi:MAG: late competence development ComFB family protein [Candidatus Omnitrophota bacterium]